MTLGVMCCLMAVVYGVVSGGVYTWISPRRRKAGWGVMLRATMWFTLAGIIISAMLYMLFR